MQYDVIVIGGGASGMMAAIRAARNGKRVVILEKNDRIGKKILATGNGKCNFGNRYLQKDCYQNKDREKVWQYIEKYSTDNSCDFFRELGMLVKERNGYLYPLSEQASTVLDLMRLELERLKVQIVTEFEVGKVIKKENLFAVARAGEKAFDFTSDKIIVACGTSAGLNEREEEAGIREGMLQSFSLRFHPFYPALVQLRCKENYMKAVAGIRMEGTVILYIDDKEKARETGEIQLTEYGISGIPVFQLSRYASYGCLKKQKVTAVIDCFPGFTKEEYEEMMEERMHSGKGKQAQDFFLGMANKKLLLQMIKNSGLKPEEKLCEENHNKFLRVFSELKEWKLTILEPNPVKNAQICAGGLDLSECDEHLQIKKVPGLYVIGEYLDIDGRCGGYNLHWAWTSGTLAGNHASNS